MTLLRVGEAAERLGVHAETVRRWVDEGDLEGYRVGPQSQRRIPESEIQAFLEGDRGDRGTAVYARVSTRKQDDSGNLDRQKGRLVDYCAEQEWSVDAVIEDVASGVNENRRGLDKLLKMVSRGELERVVVEYKDRIARFGFAYLERFLGSHDVRLVVIQDDDESSYEQELVEDMLSIVTSFSARLYGRRGGKKVASKTREGIEACK